MNLKYHPEHGVENLNCLIDHIMCHIREKNRITLRIKEKYLKLLMPETMKLLGSTKCKINNNNNNNNNNRKMVKTFLI